MGHKKLAKAVYQQFHGFLESDKNWHKKLAKTGLLGSYLVYKSQILKNWQKPKGSKHGL
jgi:hypothetical protein